MSTTACATVVLAVGAVAAFLDAVGTNRFGMRLFPDVGTQRFVVARAGEETIEHVLDVGPDIQVVANGAAYQGKEVGSALAGGDATYEKPVFAADGNLFHQLFNVVVVDRHPCVAKVKLQRLPVTADVVQRLAKTTFGQDLRGSVAREPLAQRCPDRSRLRQR